MTSKKGLELIEHFEGCRLEAYQDVKGVWTIGIGTTRYPFGEKVKEGDVLETREQAVELMKHDLKMAENVVAKLVNVPMDQNEFDALVSFTYNVGITAFSDSGLLKKINDKGSALDIETEFFRWCYSGNRAVAGLIRRRKAEAWLYLHNELKFFE